MARRRALTWRVEKVLSLKGLTEVTSGDTSQATPPGLTEDEASRKRSMGRRGSKCQ